MQISVSSTLTLYHDGQFWVGVIEHVEDGIVSAARIVFGAEPSDEEVFEFVIKKWNSLHFVGDVVAKPEKMPANPKRRQREASKRLSKRGASTKAQAALSQAREEIKVESRSVRAQRKREDEADRFSKRMAKKKEKRKGH